MGAELGGPGVATEVRLLQLAGVVVQQIVPPLQPLRVRQPPPPWNSRRQAGSLPYPHFLRDV